MKRKLKTALEKFNLHIEGSTEINKVRGGYNRKRVHELADRWLADIGEINACAVSDDEGKACCRCVWQAIDAQVAHGDYLAAKLLILRAFPVLERYGSSKSIREELEAVDISAMIQGRNPYANKYVNFYELNKAIERYVEEFKNSILAGILINSTHPQDAVALELPKNYEKDLRFIETLIVFGGEVDNCSNDGSALDEPKDLKYYDAIENLLIILARAYHVTGNYDKELHYLNKIVDHNKAHIERLLYEKEYLQENSRFITTNPGYSIPSVKNGLTKLKRLQLTLGDTISEAKYLQKIAAGQLQAQPAV